jgi:hypothetical protein
LRSNVGLNRVLGSPLFYIFSNMLQLLLRKGVKFALDSRCACHSMSWCAEMSQEQI